MAFSHTNSKGTTYYLNSKDVTLILNVIHGKEIDIEYNKKKIIDKINTYFGYSFIKNIHVKIINVKFIDSSKNHTTKINKKSFINNLKKVENINLKNKLEKLIKAYNEKN